MSLKKMAFKMSLKTIFFTLLLCTVKVRSDDLGQSVNAHSHDFYTNEVSGEIIFEWMSKDCKVDAVLQDSGNFQELYTSVDSFYDAVSSHANVYEGLKGAYSMGETLYVKSNHLSSGEVDIIGTSLHIYNHVAMRYITKDCLHTSILSTEFLTALDALESEIAEPWRVSSWRAYADFLQKYGTHVLTKVFFGSSVRQWVFAKAEKKYTAQQLTTMACAYLRYATEATCSSVTQQQYNGLATMHTNTQLELRGGSDVSRNSFRNGRNRQNMLNFLQEKSNTYGPTKYEYTAIWDILKEQFKNQPGRKTKALNLMQFYMGLLDYGCTEIESNEVHLRYFDYCANSLSCFLIEAGCNSDSDCHLGEAANSAYCYGDSCFEHEEPLLREKATQVSVRTTQRGAQNEGVNQGCERENSSATCTRKKTPRKKIIWQYDRATSNLSEESCSGDTPETTTTTTTSTTTTTTTTSTTSTSKPSTTSTTKTSNPSTTSTTKTSNSSTTSTTKTSNSSTTSTTKTSNSSTTSEPPLGALGEAVNIHEHDLYSTDVNGKIIFEGMPSRCIKEESKHDTGNVLETYASTEMFYESLSTYSEIAIGLKGRFSMGASLSAKSSQISSGTVNVMGTSLYIFNHVAMRYIEKDCLYASKLSKEFLKEFDKLEEEVNGPWFSESWSNYESFLKHYGSHLITKSYYGSSLRQWVFAKVEERYEEERLKGEACGHLFFATACSGVEDVSSSQTASIKTEIKFELSGGNTFSRNQLREEQNQENLKSFIDGAQRTHGPVKYQYTAIWDILSVHFNNDTARRAKALTLMQYYMGFKVYECTPIKSGKVYLRYFGYCVNRQQTYKPVLSCILIEEGCNSDKDCVTKSDHVSTYCAGETCYEHTHIEGKANDVRVRKKIAGNTNEGVNKYCKWHMVRFNPEGKCSKEKAYRREIIWQYDSELSIEMDYEDWEKNCTDKKGYNPESGSGISGKVTKSGEKVKWYNYLSIALFNVCFVLIVLFCAYKLRK